MATKSDIAAVNRAFLDELFDSEDYTPRGLFLCEEIVDGRLVYVAVNNAHGQALTEEFYIKRTAVLWLHGYSVLNRWRERLDGEEIGGCKGKKKEECDDDGSMA